MTDIMLWLTGHRTWLIGLIALALWCAAYSLYFKRTMRQYFHRSKPHSWSIDMVNKRAMSRGKQEIG